MELYYTVRNARTPVIAAAIHDGHRLDPGLYEYMHLAEHERFREEDPYTRELADLPITQVIVESSRFQTDLNRRREQAIYRKPADAWGLTVWRPELPEVVIERLLAEYDRFYADMALLIQQTISLFGAFIVLDIHTYNHRRDHPWLEAPVGENPEVNVGTGYNQEKWMAMGRHLVRFLAHHQHNGRMLDVRENVRFRGGGFAEWLNHHYGEYGCVFSLEFKKTFVDEWTGRVDIGHLTRIRTILEGYIPFLLDQLDTRVKPSFRHGH